MIRKFLCLLILGYSTVAFSEGPSFPRVIDFGKMDISGIPGYDSLDLEELAEEYSPFNGAIELATYFNYLKNTFQIDTAIETGTWQGSTTAFLGYLFDEVRTMEINVEAFEKALVTLRPYSNVVVHYGNSPDILRQILPSFKSKRLLFYLDAHWLNEWPLLEEIEVISKTHKDNCIIVIDDFKVPDRSDIPYDAYSGGECSYEYIKLQLNKAYSDYYYYYVIPKSVNARAKFVAIPKKWASASN